MSFLYLPSPSSPQASSQKEEGGSDGFIASLRRMSRASILLLVFVALLLGVYVGSEVSFGAYVLVYSHERFGLDEVLFFASISEPHSRTIAFRVPGSILLLCIGNIPLHASHISMSESIFLQG